MPTRAGLRIALMAFLSMAGSTPTLAAPAPETPAPGTASVDRPPRMPDHDAAVTYRVTPDGQTAQNVRVFFGSHGNKLRIDGPSGQGDTILDRATGMMTVVLNGPHAYMEVPSKGPVSDPFILGDAMNYQRTGTTHTLAGVSCTDWRITSDKGDATACVTSDGLLLSATGVDGTGTKGSVTALNVVQDPLPPGIFSPPSDYQRIAHPIGQP